MSSLIPSSQGERRIYTISEFNAEIKQLLLDHVTSVWLQGELSNLSFPDSGHLYFTLKDADAQIRCVMFRSKNRNLAFNPDNGMQVTLYARPDLYEVRGIFQLIVNHMEISGHGELQRRFEQLKHKLMKEGLFDQSRKQPLPPMPQRVGVVTSRSGAALHDVLSTLKRRFPAIEVVVYPTPVQGDEASAAICHMLELANRRGDAEVLILVRGGGSLEDLQPFNEERVARAIAASMLPIITGIGHDVDFTIADFVADEHAPTPTAAAQRASPDRHTLAQNLKAFKRQLRQRLENQLATARQTLAFKRSQLLHFFHPALHIERWMQQLDDANEKLHSRIGELMRFNSRRLETARMALTYQAPLRQLRAAQLRCARAARALDFAMRSVESRRRRVAGFAARLELLSPFATLKRGYSLTTDERGRIVRSTATLSVGQGIKVRVADGHLSADIKKLGGKD